MICVHEALYEGRPDRQGLVRGECRKCHQIIVGIGRFEEAPRVRNKEAKVLIALRKSEYFTNPFITMKRS